MDGNVVRRVGFAIVAIPVAAAIVYLGGWPLVVLLSLAGLLGTRELYDLAQRTDVRPLRIPGLLAAMLMAPATYAVLRDPRAAAIVARWWGLGLAAVVIVILLWLLASRGPNDRPLAVGSITLFGVLYAGALPSVLLVIRHGGVDPRPAVATALVFFPLVVTWICDTAAMFGGRSFKGPRMAPTISPGKTWSGGVSGVVGALLAVPLLQLVMLRPLGLDLGWLPLMVIALAIGLLGQLGDLAESLFKREAGVKDSSNLIPGHGGVLDRLDSLYFVLPVTVLLYRLFGVI